MMPEPSAAQQKASMKSLSQILPVPHADSQQLASSCDFEAMKAILEPFDQIFTTITEHINTEVVNRIEHTSFSADFGCPVYSLHPQNDDLNETWARGATALPLGTSPYV